MSDNHDYLGTADNPKLRLFADVLLLQMKGAGYAALFCLAMLILIWGLYGIGLLLPEESRDTEDPTPFSHMITVTGAQSA